MTTLPLATALVAGLVHALEADHMAAVTTFVSRRPHPVRALGFGVRWGVGHSAALLVAGGAVVLLGLDVPAGLIGALEVSVGAMLVCLGGWSIATVFRDSRGGAAHAHPAGSGATWVGAAHGAAGTAGFLAIVPVMLISSPWSAGGYLLVFGAGTIVAMGAYALLAGIVFHRAGVMAPKIAIGLRVIAGAASVAIGVAWMYGAHG